MNNPTPLRVRSHLCSAATDQSAAELLASTDANDLLYQVQSSFDYDPAPDLENLLKISQR